MTAKAVLEICKKKNIKMVDLKFIDMPGVWQHFSVPVDKLDEETFETGVGFDGSSIRGFQAIDESDMLLIPDPNTANIDPFCQIPTLSLICDVKEPGKQIKEYNRDPRYIARKAEKYLGTTGIADASFWGPELEFFIFDDIRFNQTTNSGYYFIDSIEGNWNNGREENPNLGYKIRPKEGYFPVPPTDSYQDLRTEMVLELQNMGIDIEAQHHEVATGGQAEIDMRYNALLVQADNVMIYKYVLRNVAKRHNKIVTFMPKPLFGDNGTGMHIHSSLWKAGKPLFFDAKGYGMLSETALFYIGGILKHASALLALCAPSTNSFKRLVPGFEAPVNLVYSQRNRSAACRIPVYSQDPKQKRIEFRCPDCTCNPYLAFPAILMAGLDGIQNKIHPGAPVDKDLFELPAEELKKIKVVPDALDKCLVELEKDHDFLLKGGVFTKDVLETWINYKRSKEVDAIRLRPHPWEFYLYFDL